MSNLVDKANAKAEKRLNAGVRHLNKVTYHLHECIADLSLVCRIRMITPKLKAVVKGDIRDLKVLTAQLLEKSVKVMNIIESL